MNMHNRWITLVAGSHAETVTAATKLIHLLCMFMSASS